MRLGVNGRFLAARTTGVQRFAHEVVRRLAQETDVVVFVPAGSDVDSALDGVCVRVVRGRTRGQLFEQLELPALTARHCDVLLQPANSGSIRTRVPTVLVLHDALALTNPEWFAPAFARWYRFMLPRVLRSATRVVTVSEFSRREICRAGFAAPARTVVVPQGLAPFDAPADSAAVAAVRARFTLPPRFLLAVGTGARKNIAFLAPVLHEWRRRHGGSLPLVVAGAAEQHVFGGDGAHLADVGGAVRMLGAVSDDDLHALYTAASVVCFPSHAEGFGRPPLEAIACGTPAVVAPYGPARETLAGIASARITALDPQLWADAIAAQLEISSDIVRRDAGALRQRWTWDGAAAGVLNACLEAATSARRALISMPAAPPARTPRIALVHDWLTGMRGGERVLEELLGMYPGADIFTLVHVKGAVTPLIEEHVVRTSFADRLPGAHRHYRYYLPFFPAAAAGLAVSGYDLIISSSHCTAHGVTAADVPHLSYCHTPMRYIWDRRGDYMRGGVRGIPLRMGMAALAPALRRWDVRSADRIDRVLANSEHVRARIRTCWGRDAAVVYPPVDVDRFRPAPSRDDAYVIAGALVPYKRVDLAVRAFNALGRRLLVVGDGPEYGRLRALAGATIEFTGRVTDDEMATLLGRARGLIMPMVEDFGIIAVEAQAAGAPVIAYDAGGVKESVIGWSEQNAARATGMFFHLQTPAAIVSAVLAAERTEFDQAALRANAMRFTSTVFRAGVRAHADALLRAAATDHAVPSSHTSVRARSARS